MLEETNTAVLIEVPAHTPSDVFDPAQITSTPELRRNDSVETGLKNYSKWRKVPNTASTAISRFVPMKLPYDSAHGQCH